MRSDECTAVYNLFWDFQQTTFVYDTLPSLDYGLVGQKWSCCPLNIFPPDPEKAGCNIIDLIDEALTENIFYTSSSPIEQLSLLGTSKPKRM